MEDLLGRGKERKTSINLGDKSSSTSFQKPEIHSLARLESDLALTLAYCQQCQGIYESSGILARLFGNIGYFDSKNRALENAGRTVRDARNYEINPPSSDFIYSVYKFFRPAVLAVASQIEPYRDASKLREVLESPINKRIEEKKGDVEESKRRLMRRPYEKERATKLEEEIKALEESKRTVLFTTMLSEGMDDFLKYALEKGLDYVNNLIGDVKREAVIRHLKQTREAIYKLGLEIREPANEFVTYCSGIAKPSATCSGYRSKLAETQKELFKVFDERKSLDEEFKSGMSFLLDFPIGILSIMNDEEFEAVKKLGLEFIKDQIS